MSAVSSTAVRKQTLPEFRVGPDSEKLAMSTMGPLCPEQLTQEETLDEVWSASGHERTMDWPWRGQLDVDCLRQVQSIALFGRSTIQSKPLAQM
jgi:hypothetical protein